MAEEKIKVGQQAPDFTLRDSDRQEVKLSDLRGQPVMIAFYPAAFSPVCEGEMCTIRDEWAGFAQAGAKVLAISRDGVWSLKAWKEQKGFQHTLLSAPLRCLERRPRPRRARHGSGGPGGQDHLRHP
jgi:mycoredoxin-dependent peroxiredoxin